jgi:hypothetical protein
MGRLTLTRRHRWRVALGLLWVVSSDFAKSLSEFATGSKVPPTQVEWCGADSVVPRSLTSSRHCQRMRADD